MSAKPKFRSRKLDYKRGLPIYHSGDLPDLDDEAHRAVPVVATGVEKEEEEEHHLQAVMSAAQVRDTEKSSSPSVYIPTPDASQVIDYYERLYSRRFQRTKTFIKSSDQVEDMIGPEYCMDDRDLEWLSTFNKGKSQSISPEEFELLVTELEKVTDRLQASSPDTFAGIESLEDYVSSFQLSSTVKDSIAAVYGYWKEKRSQKKGKSLMAKLKFEEAFKGESDPYICFRKRDIRPTRKTRRADSLAVSRLQQLKTDMETAKAMLEMVTRRERMKREYLLLEQAVFEQKLLIKKSRSEFGIPDAIFEEARAARKKAARIRMSAQSNARIAKPMSTRKRKISISEDELAHKDPILIEIENEVNKRKQTLANFEDVTETGVSLWEHPASKYFYPVEGPHKDPKLNAEHIRRRIGRGGRLLVDRCRKRKVDSESSNDSQNLSQTALSMQGFMTKRLGDWTLSGSSFALKFLEWNIQKLLSVDVGLATQEPQAATTASQNKEDE